MNYKRHLAFHGIRKNGDFTMGIGWVFGYCCGADGYLSLKFFFGVFCVVNSLGTVRIGQKEYHT
jgi:hypothetical protein